MAKYEGWTLGETEALLNVVGGAGVARAVLRGERKLVVKAAVRPQASACPPLVGTVIESVDISPFRKMSVADAIRMCNCRGVDVDIGYSFPAFDVELTKAVSVDLFRYNRDWFYDDLDAWVKANGKQPIMPKHILALRIQHPEVRAYDMIIEIGGRHGRPDVLGLFGSGDHRRLGRSKVEGYQSEVILVGFLRE